MDKEDILKRSREENANGDEREEKIKLRSYSISAIFGASLCMIFCFIEKTIFDRDATLLLTICLGMAFCDALLNAVKLKKSGILFILLFGDSVLVPVSFVTY